MNKRIIKDNLIREDILPSDLFYDPQKQETIDRALLNVILDHPELVEEETRQNERLEIFDKYVGKGGHLKFATAQIQAMVKIQRPVEKIMEFIDRQTNEHRSDLIQDDLRYLRELDNSRWNLFELDFSENRPGDLGASFSLSFAGVYVAYEENDIIYIGTPVNIRQRLIQHIFPCTNKFATPLYKYLNGDFNGIKIKVKKMEKFFRLRAEARLIHRIKPIVNTHYRERES